MPDLSQWIDSINNAVIGDWAVLTGRVPTLPAASSTQAATYALAQQQQGNQTLLILAAIGVVLIVATRRK